MFKIRVVTILLLMFFNIFCEATASLSESEENKLDHEDPQSNFFLWQDDNGNIREENLTKKPESFTAQTSDVNLYFYSKSNPNEPVVLNVLDVNKVIKTKFNSSKECLFIVHGWLNNYSSPVNVMIKGAVLEKYDVNVFVVDWSAISKNGYIECVANIERIGKFIGHFINNLSKKYNYPLSKIKMVGHSLGAHIAGVAGKTTNGQLKYIIGLDPAGPLFTIVITKNRLNKGDARYVEVIHTTASLSFHSPIGNGDYYPNGGVLQPGCVLSHDRSLSCSHSRAYELYAESVSVGSFVSTRCGLDATYELGLCANNDKSQMGGFVFADKPDGKFYLKTSGTPPFALGN
ncbi:hypothetical protein NQ318_013532 [Aromia moschata]|uniref:Lipase domain-containing protein n=1 Tax=Aromia moschata TaxID=1265417 RepID=A0AAV8XXX0_9CUCU|nr:hypothetical protein NQ318_013532 [Aromia moschata]